MALFDYQAIDHKGKEVKGKIDAANEKAAKLTLQQQRLYVHSLKVAKESKRHGKKHAGSQGKVSSGELANFTRQFATLQATAIPYDKALEVMIQESKESPLIGVMSEMKSKITEGQSLAQALEGFKQIFSGMYIAMVRAGEAGGTLPQVMERLAKFMEEQEELKSKVQGAMIYPLIMITLGIGIVIFMLTFILPKITPIFEQFNVELPFPTRAVLFLSDVITGGWWALIILVGGGIYGFKRFKSTEKGKYRIDQTLLRIPVLNKLLNKIYHFRFTQTLAVLMGSGVDLKQSLSIVSRVMGNRVYEEKFAEVTEDITKKGLDLSQALKRTKLFPPSLLQMIRVGEESGELETMLDKVALNLDKEVSRALEKALALLEPMMILLMAVMVGFIVLAVMLPMFELNQML